MSKNKHICIFCQYINIVNSSPKQRGDLINPLFLGLGKILSFLWEGGYEVSYIINNKS